MRDGHGHHDSRDRRPRDLPFAFTQTIPTRPTTSGVTITSSSAKGIKAVLHPISALASTTEVYAALLGVAPQADESYYVGFEAAGQHIGLVPGGGPQGMTAPVAYWHVPGLEAKLAEVTAAGATVKEPERDVGGGRVVATVADPDGNVLGLLQDRCVPTFAPTLGVTATPSISSVTTSMPGWPVPGRTVRRPDGDREGGPTELGPTEQMDTP